VASFTLVENENVEFEVIPANTVLEATLEEVIVKDSFWDIDESDPSKGKKKQVSFKFKVSEEGEYKNRVLWGNTPTTFTTHPDCKLRVWVMEILGQDDLAADFTFDTEHLEGLPVKIVVGNREGKHQDGSPKRSDYAEGVIRMESGVADADDIF
jgi:hypothetical protein